MENYLMLDGKKIEIGAELAEMLAQAVKQEPEKGDPFARALNGEQYFYIGADGTAAATREEGYTFDSHCFSVANYCTDPELMERRALHETLNRLLWRYSEQHGRGAEWGSVEANHYSLYLDALNDKWRIQGTAVCIDPGVVYFRDARTAQAAIKEIVEPFMEAHPEFVW